MTGPVQYIPAEVRRTNRLLYRQLGLPFDQVIDEKHFSWVHVSYRKEGNRKQVLAL